MLEIISFMQFIVDHINSVYDSIQNESQDDDIESFNESINKSIQESINESINKTVREAILYKMLSLDLDIEINCSEKENKQYLCYFSHQIFHKTDNYFKAKNYYTCLFSYNDNLIANNQNVIIMLLSFYNLHIFYIGLIDYIQSEFNKFILSRPFLLIFPSSIYLAN